MVLSFSKGLDFLLDQMIREQLLTELDAVRTPKLGIEDVTAQTWSSLVDSETIVEEEPASLKGVVFDKLVRPHFEGIDRDKRMWSAIFFGPPGTAKTSLAGEISRFLGWPLITVQASDFLVQGADRMAYQARLIFRKLGELSDTVVLFDEVEEFVRVRSPSTDKDSRLITTAMLTLLQGLRDRQSVLLIMATNRPGDFDSAIKRPGRFDLLLYVPPPSFEEKMRLLREELAKTGCRLHEAADALLRQSNKRDLIDRFTFHDWQRFVGSCATGADNVSELDRKTVSVVLDRLGESLTIEGDDWDDWKKEETRIYG